MSEGVVEVSATSIRRYYGWALVVFAAGLVAGFLMIGAGGFVGSAGALLYLGIYAGLVATNWNGFVRAIAAHRWFRGQQGAANGCLILFLYLVIVPYVLGFYPFYGLYQYARGYLNQRKLDPIEQRRRIATLEARLGIEPTVEGQCPHCGKPLQVDAEFCGYCGKRVQPEVRVCPKCGTVSLPNAEWCARCGTSLGTVPRTE